LIAVVDDYEAIRKALSRLLRAYGLDSVTFSSGPEFLDSLAARRPDCALVDLDMPEMNGFEVQARLAPSGIPVILLTGNDSDAKRTRALAGGAVAYFAKPVNAEPLLDAIYLALGRVRPPDGDANH
jgi:CheY-like chemotaxis protein